MKNIYLFLLLLLPVLAPAQSNDASKAAASESAVTAQQALDSGIAAYQRSDYDKALTQLNTAADMAKNNTDSTSQKVLMRSYNNIGNVYADRGNNPVALQNYHQALTVAEHIADKKNIAHINKNIGAIYLSWLRFDEALDYYHKAETAAKILGDNSLIADCYNNEGTVYEQKKIYDTALMLYKDALEYYTKADRKESISMALSNIAIIYKSQKNYVQALDYNIRSLDISKAIDDKWTIAATMNNIGNIYGETGDVKKAIEYCTQSVDIARQINAIQIVIAALESMAEATAKNGLYAQAYKYMADYTKAKDSFINTESTKQLSELQVKYETQKKETENERLRYKNSKAEKEKQFIMYFSLAVVVFLVFLFLLIYNNRVVKAKAQEQQNLNRIMFDSEQKERMRIARDLHDSIGQMLSVMKMQLSGLSTKEDNDENERVAQLGTLLDNTIQEVRHISHNLIPEELNFGILNALDDMCSKINSAEGTTVSLNVDEALRSYKFNKQFELSIYRIVQEILNNMLKHAEAKEIKIDLQKKDASVLLDIRDDGKGFDTSVIKNSGGLGWKNIFARVNLMNGKIEISSEKIKGTQIQILLPQ